MQPDRQTTRVLDMGCHDGFIGAGIRGQLGDDVEWYGMELHPKFAAIAEQRGYLKVARAPAEDAPLHFEAHSFDAVVCYELLEHVPNMVVLLAAAERMLKPDGRIFLSTPDGCYGAGRNPHHLRALRSLDLADLLRRRGHLVEMGVGEDGLTLASYQPARKRGEIAIYCGPGWEEWSPVDITTRGLGGSETAAFRVGEALAQLGYVVTLYGQVEDGCFGDLMLRDWRTFDPTERRQAVISSRIPELFDRSVNAARRLLWAHDTDFGDRLTEARAVEVDHVLCLSSWHREHLTAMYPSIADRLRQVRNGIVPGYFTGPAPEREKRVLYTSSPDRGLDVLLEVWPSVLERVPDAELVHCYAPVYDRIADQNPTVGAFRDRVRKLADQPGVRSLSRLSQPQLAELMRSSLVWAHPSYSTTAGGRFHETSCIGAMEAQAAGCCVVAGAWGALPETVQVGTLIDGDPTQEPWRERFADAIVQGLTGEGVQANAQVEGPAVALGWDWVGVADMIATLAEPAPLPEPALSPG